MTTDTAAQIIWKYHQLSYELVKADAIVVLGSHDLRVAGRGAELYLDGWAPHIIFTGNVGRHTDGLWGCPKRRSLPRWRGSWTCPRRRS